jgi:hypothetical protein
MTIELPEPMAKLHQVKPGDTAESLAVAEFKSAVRDGHDLRYYENVLLTVNRDQGRAGITGSFQAPGLLGGGSNNVHLVAGHRIWLVSPAYAQSLEGQVPDGSLTNGVYAKAKRFAGHIVDILTIVTQSPQFFAEVAGEFAQAIADHMPLIIGMVAGFITLEAASALLAAAPTGVSQIVAVLIQLLLAAVGAYGMVEAGVQALQHGGKWLTLAWTAQGDEGNLAAASKEFLKMLVAVAMAALAYAGVKGNFGNALKISSSMPMPMPAMALAGGGQMGGGGAGTAVALGGPGPLTGIGAGGAMMVKHEGEGGGSRKTTDAAGAQEELAQIKEKLKDSSLSGKEKSRLRARRNELQEQLGTSSGEPEVRDAPTRSDFKRRTAGLTGKEAATDIPGWAKTWPDAGPYVDESGVEFASRMMDKHYGAGKWTREGKQATEFSELKKFGDREVDNLVTTTSRPWGYAAPIGEWIFSLLVPADQHDTSLGPLWHVLQLVMPLVTPMHRLRKGSVSWGEFDANGHEQGFHELVEIEDVDWNSPNRRLRERLVGEFTAVSALFLELDTWVISDASAPEMGTWAEASAELQVSFLAPELRPPLATVTYSTAIDVWLPVTYDQHFASRSNVSGAPNPHGTPDLIPVTVAGCEHSTRPKNGVSSSHW